MRQAQLAGLVELAHAARELSVWLVDRDLRFVDAIGESMGRRGGLTGARSVRLDDLFGRSDPGFAPVAAHRRALEGKPAAYALSWGGMHYDCFVRPVRDETGEVWGVLGMSILVEGDDLDRVRASEIHRGTLHAATRLARGASVEGVLESALAEIGWAAGARRALLVENEERREVGVLRARWVGQDVVHQEAMPRLARLAYDASVREALQAGLTRCFHVDDLDPMIGGVLRGWGVREVACTPVVVRGSWWGSLKLVYDTTGALGPRSLEAVAAAGEVLAAAIELGDLSERIAREIDARSMPPGVSPVDLGRVRGALEGAARLTGRLEEILERRHETAPATQDPTADSRPPRNR